LGRARRRPGTGGALQQAVGESRHPNLLVDGPRALAERECRLLQRLAHCGSAFRALAGLSWELPNLASDWAHACATDLQVYVSELDDASSASDGASDDDNGLPGAGADHRLPARRRSLLEYLNWALALRAIGCR